MAASMAAGCSSAHTPATASTGQPGSASPAATPTTPGATAPTSPDPASAGDCAFDTDRAATVDKLCAAIAARFEDGASCDRSESHLETAITDEIEIEDKALTRAALFSIYVPEDHSDHVYIALRYRGAWHMSTLVTIYNPGAFGISEYLEITSFKSDQLIPGGSPEVVIKFVKIRNDTDMGIDEEEGSTRAVVAVLGALGGKISHLMAVEEDYKYHRDRLGLMDEVSDTAIAGDAAAEPAAGDAARALPIERTSGASVRFVPARGSVIIEARENIAPSHQPGVYSLQTFPVRCLPYFNL